MAFPKPGDIISIDRNLVNNNKGWPQEDIYLVHSCWPVDKVTGWREMRFRSLVSGKLLRGSYLLAEAEITIHPFLKEVYGVKNK